MTEIKKSKKQYFFYIAVFTLGLSIGLFISTQKNRPIIKSTGLNIAEVTQPDLYGKLDNIEQQTGRLFLHLNDINQKIIQLSQTVLKNSIAGGNIADYAEADKNQNTLIDEEEISLTKDKLYAHLTNSTMTLSEFLSSKEIQSLPKADRNEVYNEFVRRFRSGEINKAQLFPGYRE